MNDLGLLYYRIVVYSLFSGRSKAKVLIQCIYSICNNSSCIYIYGGLDLKKKRFSVIDTSYSILH